MNPEAILQNITSVLDAESAGIQECANRIRKDPAQKNAFLTAVKEILSCLDRGGKMVITGVGKSGHIGQKIAGTFASTGALAVYLHPTDGLHGDLGLVRSEDLMIVISNTGNTEEVVRLIPLVRRMGVGVISICGKAQSRIAVQSQVWLDASVPGEAHPDNVIPSASSTLALAIGDALALTTMQIRGFDREKFAASHPGGGLGQRLKLAVQDLMHSGDALPVLLPQASIDQVIEVLTRKKLGAACVVQSIEQPVLLGIITDGDLRRSLQHRDRFFRLTAQDVMKASPITVNPEAKAESALQLMEKRESQISVLPVVNSKGMVVGVLRLHDVVGSI